jgi:hypothetical protein
MSAHQKAAHKVGEVRVSRAQIADLLELARSPKTQERLLAATFLCPCHVKARIPVVWEALYRLMADPEQRVRLAAWHTLEDGGLPSDRTLFAWLEELFTKETDPKLRRFIWQILGNALRARQKEELVRQNLASRPVRKVRGKCDFCGACNVFVEQDLDTLIPTPEQPRPALICDHCVRSVNPG